MCFFFSFYMDYYCLILCNILHYYITKKKDRFSLAESVHVASKYIVIYTGLRVQAGKYYSLK